jgi:hypothetical protein
MMFLKACPKCHGDLTVENDAFARAPINRETDFACLQCGYRLAGADRARMLARALRAYAHAVETRRATAA